MVNRYQDRMYRYLLIISALMLGLAAPGLSAQENPVPAIAEASLRIKTETLDDLWRETLELLEQDDLQGALRKIEELNLEKAMQGFRNLPAQSAVLVQSVRALRARKRIDDALALAERARQLSPDWAPGYFTLARLRLSHRVTDIYGYARDMALGLLARYRDMNAIVTTGNRVFSVLLLAGGLTSLVFVLFAFLYYRQAVFYYVFKHTLPLPIPMLIASVLGWIVIGVVTLTLGVAWGVLLLAASLIAHLEKGTRIILNLVFVWACLLGLLLVALGTTYAYFEDDYFQALRDVSFGTYTRHTVDVLQARVRQEPDDAYALFGLAAIAAHAGAPDQAIAVYSTLPFSFPDYAAAQNNLGALYHRQYLDTKSSDLYQKANESYDSAIMANRRQFEPRYNLAQLRLTDLSESDEVKNSLLQTAMDMDEARFNELSQYVQYNLVAHDATLSATALLKKLVEPAVSRSGLALAKELWRSGSRFDNPVIFSAAALALLILSALAGPPGKSPKRVAYCQMCGDPFTVKIKRRRTVRRARDDEDETDKKKAAPEVNTFCTQCTYIFKKKTTVKPEKRVQKVNQIQMRQNVRALIAKIGSLLCPGGGQIYYGYPLKGILLAGMFYLGLSLLTFTMFSTRLLVPEGYPGWSLATLILAGLLMGAAYLMNLVDVLKLSPRNQ